MGLARSQEELRNSDEIKEKMRELAEENKIEIDWGNKAKISYIVGVVHGDGYDDSKGTIGLEVKDQEFADKFMENLRIIGLNPNSKMRRGKINVWAASIELVSWLNAVENEIRDWLLNEGSPWDYIEGLYDSDGNLHPSGSPRICSYDEESKEFIQGLLTELQIESNIQQNNVWVSSSSADKFFENIDPVPERRRR